MERSKVNIVHYQRSEMRYTRDSLSVVIGGGAPPDTRLDPRAVWPSFKPVIAYFPEHSVGPGAAI
jgi:hypothetical protein